MWVFFGGIQPLGVKKEILKKIKEEKKFFFTKRS
jgi:hypothetical protein